MRGLDTNVIVRYLTEDDPAQFAVAREWLEHAEKSGGRFFINVVVLCELVWTLRGDPFGLERAEIASVMEQLLETPLFEIQSRDCVRSAIEDYRRGSAEFADYLIGRQNLQAGCEHTATFDTRLVESDLFGVLGT